MRKFPKIIAVSFFTFFLVACGAAQGDLPRNELGHALEDLAPYDSNLVVTYGIQDQMQRDNFSNFLEKLGLTEFWDAQMVALNDQLGAQGLSFEEDLKPMLGENYRGLIAFEIDTEGAGDDDEDGSIELYEESDYLGEFVVAFTIADESKAREFMQFFAEGENMIQGDKGGYMTVTDTVNGTHLILFEDFLAMTVSDDALDNLVERYEGGGSSLAENKRYLQALGGFDEPQLAYVYLTFENLKTDEGFADILEFKSFNAVNYAVYGMNIREDGFSFEGVAELNKKEMKKAGIDISMFSGPGVYLADKLNGDDLVAYSETYNVAGSMRSNPIFDLPEVKDGFRAFFGTDIEEGLFSWMDKGVAVIWQNSGGMFPGFSIVFDAGSNVDAAREFYTKLDSQLAGYLVLAGDGEAIKSSKQGDLTVIAVDLAAVDDSFAEQYPGIEPGIVELSFGLTDDELFVISFQNDFYANHGKNAISSLPKYKEAMKTIGGLDGAFAYFDFSTFDAFVKLWADIALQQQLEDQKFTNAFNDVSEEEAAAALKETETSFRAIVDSIVEVLKKIDFVAAGSEVTSGNIIKTSGYLKLR